MQQGCVADLLQVQAGHLDHLDTSDCNGGAGAAARSRLATQESPNGQRGGGIAIPAHSIADAAKRLTHLALDPSSTPNEISSASARSLADTRHNSSCSTDDMELGDSRGLAPSSKQPQAQAGFSIESVCSSADTLVRANSAGRLAQDAAQEEEVEDENRFTEYRRGAIYQLMEGKRLCFSCHRDDQQSLEEIHRYPKLFFFSSDLQERYQNFCLDFGPVNRRTPPFP